MEKFEDSDYKVIKQTRFGDVLVSTVWLGLDHSFGTGPPAIFETMVFDKNKHELDVERWSTKEEAIAGHKEFCDKYRYRGEEADAKDS